MERITTRFRTRSRTRTGARTDRPNYWRTLGVVVAAGGAVGWALVRSTRVVLAPGLDAASRGANTEAAKAGIGSPDLERGALRRGRDGTGREGGRNRAAAGVSHRRCLGGRGDRGRTGAR
jgi:hypothetical protein